MELGAGVTVKLVLEQIRSAPKATQLLAVCILLVGLHSLLLGMFIFFFTRLFYQLFFGMPVENFFFVQQSGLFLFCLGLFYLSPLADIGRSRGLVFVMILTKVMAVLFLVTESQLVARPAMILLAAWGDGLMAAVLGLLLSKQQRC